MKKVLFLATYGDFLATFELSNIQIWQKIGYEVHCASDFEEREYNVKTNRLDEIGVIRHTIKFTRSPIKIQNFNAYRELVALIREEQYEVIDCHNAVISVFARMAAAHCHIHKVIYTPHSFFFYNGCPLKNKLIFKNIEAVMAKKTDLLIAINQEDFQAASKMKVRGKALYVPGVGVDTVAINKLPFERTKYCREFNIPEDSIIFISVGELIHRKNHLTSIKAFAKANINNSYYLIAGIGELTEELNQLIKKLKMDNRIILLGYRLDVKELMKSCDVYLFPSFQEGLPVALMEAMACGLPCIASKIRGNVDLIDSGKGGELFDVNDMDMLSDVIHEIADNSEARKKMGMYNINKISEFDIRNVQRIMKYEYTSLIKE